MFDGKIVNQMPKIQSTEVDCEKCGKKIPSPETLTAVKKHPHYFYVFSYLLTDYFIYETKSGFAACYCSDKCRRSHNHRFKK